MSHTFSFPFAIAAWVLAGTLSLSVGCQPASESPAPAESPAPSESPAEPPAPSESPAPAESPDDSTAAASPLKLKFASLEEVQQYVQSLGRPAVVDYWSLSCQPCMEEFPGLVKLHQQHGDQVTCIAVDIDYDGRKSKPPESYQPAVEAFLVEQQASFPTFICTTPSDEVYATLKIVSIPSVLVFAADGSIAKKFVDAGETVGFTYAKDVTPFVTEMLSTAEAGN